jgi:hypothetical protein
MTQVSKEKQRMKSRTFLWADSLFAIFALALKPLDLTNRNRSTRYPHSAVSASNQIISS